MLQVAEFPTWSMLDIVRLFAGRITVGCVSPGRTEGGEATDQKYFYEHGLLRRVAARIPTISDSYRLLRPRPNVLAHSRPILAGGMALSRYLRISPTVGAECGARPKRPRCGVLGAWAISRTVAR